MTIRRSLSMPTALLAVAAAYSGCVREGNPLAPLRPDPPVLGSASPATILAGTGSSVTVTGDRFRTTTAWTIATSGVTLARTAFVSAQEFRLDVTVAPAAADGPVTVTAENPGSAAVSAALFAVVSPSAPKVLTASPATLLPGATVTVRFGGENFQSGLVFKGPGNDGVSWGAASFGSASSADCVVTVSATASPGPRDVTVINPDGRKGTAIGLLSVGSAADPAVFFLQPGSGAQGQSGFGLQVRGANFRSGATVAFSGSGISVRGVGFASASRLDLSVDIAASAPVGRYDVTVTNPDGRTATAARAFSVTAAAPAVRFSTDLQPILTGNCAVASCHSGATPVLGMDLSAGSAYAALVGVTSVEVPGKQRVNPGSPGKSYLIDKLSGSQSVGGRMPLGSPALSAAEIQAFTDWIAAGAPNN